MISKFFIVSFLMAVAVASVIPSEKQSSHLVFNREGSSHLTPNARYHIIMGERVEDDVLQFSGEIEVRPGNSVRFNVPKQVINAVIVADLNENGNGDYPVPVEGGIDQDYVTLMFFSESEKLGKYVVSIYAH